MDYGEEMDRDYGHGAYGGPRAMDSYMNQSYGMEGHGGGGGGGGGGNRFGPYESYDSGSSLGGRDLYRSGYGYNEPEQSRFGGSYGGRFDSNYRNSLDSFGGRNQGGSSWEAPYSRSKLRPGFMEDRGRETYSSYSSFSSPHMKPAPVGSRGRGTPAYPDSGFGSRNYDAFGGPSTGRGRGRGYMGDFGGMHRPGIVVDYHNKPSSAAVAARGIKRKMIQQPYNKPDARTPSKDTTAEGNEAEAGVPLTDEDFTKDAYDGIYQAFEGAKPEVKNEEEEKRRIEARREKQRRRREKNSEKYGDGYSAACDTEHSLVCSRVKLRTKQLYHTEKEGRPHIDTSKTRDQGKVEEFAQALEESLPGPADANASNRWGHFKKTNKTADWFEAHSEALRPVIEEKKRALAAYKACPSERNLQILRATRNKVQTTARRCANDYWLQLCSQIQIAADTGNIKGMYDGIKQALGPTQKKIDPLKSATGEVIQDEAQEMERWVQHYSELYSRENVVTEEALNNIECLPVLEELDSEPTLEELNVALDSLASGKAPEKDSIPAEVLKCCKEIIATELHEILCLCWREGGVPQDMKDANIVTLYKNKGDAGDCSDCPDISLLSVVGKLFARVALKRLQVLAESVYPESQCEFQGNTSTTDTVFSLTQLQEKCREQQQSLFIAFIDLTKAFDLVSRGGLFKILPKIGCPPRLLSIIRSFHKDMKGTVVFDGSTSDPFDIQSGMKQGCVLVPTLFGIFFAVLLKHAFGTATEGVYLRTRSDGKLFNLSRLRAKSKVQLKCLSDFLFADDAAVTAHSAKDLQQLMDRFSKACQDFGLTVSLKEAQVMVQDVDSDPCITISEHELEVVHDFVHLGSTISDTLSLDNELNRRIGKAATTFSRLTKRVWSNKKLTENTKIQVYRACVLSTLLYCSESWALDSQQERKLNAFHTRCLRSILGISWQDKVPNNTILERAGIPSVYALLKQKRLHWLGHVVRMDDGRIPKDLLYGELVQGECPTGRPQLQYKDICKRDLKALGMDLNRMAFTCSFCKFRTFEEKDIEAHLESAVHQETLDHIQKQTKFDKVVMEFLHECMVNKFKKTAMRKQQTTTQMEAAQIPEKDLMEGVTADDHMMKVETVLCSACSVYVPALHSSVQQHLKSPEHAKGKQTYKEQIKRESVLTATSILNNPIVKARYERYVKGENPFEITDQTPEQQAEEDKADEPEEEEPEEEPEEEAEAEEEEAEAEDQTDFTLDQTEEN
ncbi:DBIRD complex subunit ZNF326 isoform X2 [Tiliqua scincoides]|uniref:DBIRD complex subunit ZNF326 isoform X2 n=1 Tax=Tiliqua scincoides TaxID=71010 RepID=UPI003463689F